MRHYILTLALTNCASIPRIADITGCPMVQWIYQAGATRDPVEDDRAETTSRSGCVRHYGPGSCLVRMIKRESLNYWAICRTTRGEEKSE